VNADEPGSLSKGRIEALSDGVFAIAMTLLVLTIGQPVDYRHLAHDLLARWPSVAAYAVSFIVIGIMWLNHHAIFSQLARVDRGVVYLNFLLLLTVVFIPYPTGVFGEALRRGEGARVAAVAYSLTMAVNAYSWAALWLYASSGRRLLDGALPEAERGRATVLFLIGTVMYTLSIGVAFLNAYACLAFHGLLAVYYAFDPLSRRAARAGAGGDGPTGPPGAGGC
jgi:uncharacterized membrane protein